MAVLGGAVYTAVCVGAREEIEIDMQKYQETHNIETTFDKVNYYGYGTYRYGLTLSKALLSTVTLCLMIDGSVSPFRAQK
jgi:hypothetical protein